MILPGGIIGGAVPSITRTDETNYTGAAATTVTFSSQSLGAEGRRHIIVAIGWNSAATLSSLTLGGTAMTVAASSVFSSVKTSINILSYPTGTTANVVATFTAGTAVTAIGVYAAYNLRSATPFDTASGGGNSGAGGTIPLSVDFAARGVGVSMLMGLSTSPSQTGLNNQVTILNAINKILAGDYTATTAETPRAITWTVQNGNTASVATFR